MSCKLVKINWGGIYLFLKIAIHNLWNVNLFKNTKNLWIQLGNIFFEIFILFYLCVKKKFDNNNNFFLDLKTGI